MPEVLLQRSPYSFRLCGFVNGILEGPFLTFNFLTTSHEADHLQLLKWKLNHLIIWEYIQQLSHTLMGIISRSTHWNFIGNKTKNMNRLLHTCIPCNRLMKLRVVCHLQVGCNKTDIHRLCYADTGCTLPHGYIPTLCRVILCNISPVTLMRCHSPSLKLMQDMVPW